MASNPANTTSPSGSLNRSTIQQGPYRQVAVTPARYDGPPPSQAQMSAVGGGLTRSKCRPSPAAAYAAGARYNRRQRAETVVRGVDSPTTSARDRAVDRLYAGVRESASKDASKSQDTRTGNAAATVPSPPTNAVRPTKPPAPKASRPSKFKEHLSKDDVDELTAIEREFGRNQKPMSKRNFTFPFIGQKTKH